MTGDAELLERWRTGETEAGRALFDRHYRAVYRFFDTKVTTGVEDLVQDTFTACVAGKERLRPDGGFAGYLFGIARNVLRQHYRRARVRGEAVSLEEHCVHDIDPSPSAVVVQKAEERLLLEGLRRIPIDYQIAFELYYWQRLTAGQMAESLGLSEAGVRSRIARAKEALRDVMASIARSPAVLQSTVTNLEAWAEGLRDQLGPQ